MPGGIAERLVVFGILGASEVYPFALVTDATHFARKRDPPHFTAEQMFTVREPEGEKRHDQRYEDKARKFLFI
jgi:hypothetical protein